MQKLLIINANKEHLLALYRASNFPNNKQPVFKILRPSKASMPYIKTLVEEFKSANLTYPIQLSKSLILETNSIDLPSLTYGDPSVQPLIINILPAFTVEVTKIIINDSTFYRIKLTTPVLNVDTVVQYDPNQVLNFLSKVQVEEELKDYFKLTVMPMLMEPRC